MSASAFIPAFQPSERNIPNIGSGNVTSISNPVSRIAYSYDPMNRLTNSTLTVSTISTSLTVSSSYDLNGNRTNIVYPGGLNVGYSYDSENRLINVTTKYTNSTKTFALGYDGASRLTSMSYPNGVNSIFGYDAESRITNYVHGAFLRHAIQRDPRGFKTQEDIYAGLVPTFTNSLHQTRTHNDADQLTVATTSPTNLTNYAYDNNGNLTNVLAEAQSTQSYSYDFDNRLISVSSVSSVVQYLYDASGARVGRVTSPGATNYFVIDYADGLKRPLAETTAAGAVTRYYVWAGFRLLAHIEANGTVRYYHGDELGSTLALSDSAGNVTDQFTYAPYGELLSRTGTNSTAFLWLGGYGVYYDSAAKLHLTLHRAYSSDMRRWLSTDPMGIDGGANLYAYGNLNPLWFVDPLGLTVEAAYTPVGLGAYHSLLILTDDDTGEITVIEGFPQNRGWEGAQMGYGNLEFAPRSAEEAANIPASQRETVSPPSGMSDAEFRRTLQQNANSYADNAPYAPLPYLSGKANSNTLIGDTLRRSGSDYEPSHWVPGWNQLLPHQPASTSEGYRGDSFIGPQK